MTDNRAFYVALEKDKDIPAEEMQKIQRTATQRGFILLTGISPVDKGTFRANWQIGVNGQEPSGTIDFEGGGSREANAAAATQEAQSRELGKVGEIRPFTRSVVVNNLPYGEELESGSSEQAPNGFLEQTYQRLKATFT